MDSELQDKVFLVTGGSGGIGQQTCRTLASEGARVVVHYRGGKERANQLAEELSETDSARAFAIRGDLRSEQEVATLFERAIREYGAVDGVVANAGVRPREHVPIEEMSLERWHNTLEVNLTGAFLTCQAFLRHLRSQPRESAAIVLIGSTAAIYGEEGHGDYSASKSALIGLTLSLKNEIVRHVPRGRVNLIHPGWVATPMAKEALEDPDHVRRVTSTIALRKVGRPDDIANAVAFLLSDRLAGHLSGTVLPIAGGMEGRVLYP